MTCPDAVQQPCRSFVMGDAPGHEWQSLLWLETWPVGQNRRCRGRHTAADRMPALACRSAAARDTIGNGGRDIGAGSMAGHRETLCDQNFIGFCDDATRNPPLHRRQARRWQALPGREPSPGNGISKREIELSRQWRGRRRIDCRPKSSRRIFPSPLQCHVHPLSGPCRMSRVALSRESKLHL